MTILLEKTINCDDGGSAARIIMDALQLSRYSLRLNLDRQFNVLCASPCTVRSRVTKSGPSSTTSLV
jgi:hypothetical protein